MSKIQNGHGMGTDWIKLNLNTKTKNAKTSKANSDSTTPATMKWAATTTTPSSPAFP